MNNDRTDRFPSLARKKRCSLKTILAQQHIDSDLVDQDRFLETKSFERMHSRRIGKFAAPSNSKRHSNTPVRKAGALAGSLA